MPMPTMPGLCAARGLPRLRLALVYVDIDSQEETVLTEDATAESLQAYFAQQCDRFIAWAEQELAHRGARDAALAALPFPHAAFRPGQRQLAEAVYKANSSGRCLMAQAPTGIGKTVGTLFPVLKACPTEKLDRLTPGRGRQAAQDLDAKKSRIMARSRCRCAGLAPRD